MPAEREIDAPDGCACGDCIELRSGGRKRLRGVRGVHTDGCGARNGGCDGSGVPLVETPSSAGCHEEEAETRSKGPALLLFETVNFFSCVRIVKGTASAVVSETECSEERVWINLARSKVLGWNCLERRPSMCSGDTDTNTHTSVRRPTRRGPRQPRGA